MSATSRMRLLPALPRIIATSDDIATRLATEFGVDPARIVVVAGRC